GRKPIRTKCREPSRTIFVARRHENGGFRKVRRTIYLARIARHGQFMWHPTTMSTKKPRSRDEYAVVLVSPETSPARGEREGYSYDDHLALAGQVADRFAQSDA